MIYGAARAMHHVVVSACAGLWKYLGEVFRQLAEQKESQVEKGHLMIDHMHIMLWIPSK